MSRYGIDDLDDYQDDLGMIHREDIDRLKKIISEYFRVYDIRWNEKTGAFYFNLNKDNLEENFEKFRLKIKDLGFIPRIAEERGESIIYVVPRPIMKKRSIWINVFLLGLTLITTTWAGAILWFGRTHPGYDFNYWWEGYVLPLVTTESLIFGFLSFALPLMIILGTHETAHYLMAKKHNIDASLPYFIPVPPPFILGTMGAFISMREPISNKKSLLDIGAAGPIAGFLVSIPILIVGFFLETMNPVAITEVSSEVVLFNEPLLFAGLRYFFPTPDNNLLHPTVFAGWVGLFVTALNLIPGGQLDGGHIARALLGGKAKYLSYIVIFVLFLLSFLTPFLLWIFFIFIILFTGTSHPPPLNDISPLGIKRKTIGASCMVMLLLCIHYAPMVLVTVPDYNLEFEIDDSEKVVTIGGSVLYIIKVNNIGDDAENIKFQEPETNFTNSNPNNWNITWELLNSKNRSIKVNNKIKLKENNHFIIKFKVKASENVHLQETISHNITVTISGLRSYSNTLILTTRVGTFDMSYNKEKLKPIPSGYSGRARVWVKNLINKNDTIDFVIDYTPPNNNSEWNVSIAPTFLQLNPNGIDKLDLWLSTPLSAVPATLIEVKLTGISQLNQNVTEIIIVLFEIELSE